MTTSYTPPAFLAHALVDHLSYFRGIHSQSPDSPPLAECFFCAWPHVTHIGPYLLVGGEPPEPPFVRGEYLATILLFRGEKVLGVEADVPVCAGCAREIRIFLDGAHEPPPDEAPR